MSIPKEFGAFLALSALIAVAILLPPSSGQCGNGLALAAADQKDTAASAFTLKDLDGNSVSLADFKDKTNVLVQFGTSWCPYCVKEIPDLNALHEKYTADELVILYVDSNEDAKTVKDLVAAHKIKYKTLLDSDGAVAEAYSVVGIPVSFLVNKEGNVVARGNALPIDEITKLIGR